jgi:Zn-finger protein
MKEKNGVQIKSCIDCVFPHLPGNYDKIIEMMSKGRE